MPSLEEYVEEIRPIFESHMLTNDGPIHHRLEHELRDFLGVRHATLFTNGHTALECILQTLELGHDGRDEVITTPFTFASTTHAIVRSGLRPVMCDVKPDDFTLDPERAEALVTDRTCAIVPVHVYGNLCDNDALQTIADEHGLALVYDAAHAFAETKDGGPIAGWGDASMLSFHATKVYNTIEGGAVCFKDDNLVQLLNDLKNFGIRGPEAVAYVGGNAKMSEFQAAMGICNLRHLDGEIAKRKAVVERYRQRLSGVEGIILCDEQKDVQPNYAYFPVVFDGYKYDRNEVFAKLKEQDIIARKYFFPLTNDIDCYRDLPSAGAEKTPVAKHIADRVLTLPLYADLSLEDVDRICDIILK
jgi:dTDP-4-amino-4,6-dideoxygalactose transaminase